ncbi:competence/damage-inducible protein A [Haliangium sp.]|uniref:competence/damage-inducible protein A n=1 Tax=Haliangium sp. TaxID=2663208 RepID=UPI003D11AAF9
MEKTAGIVIIGDEILSGKFVEENARFLIGALADLGVSLRRVSIIPDEHDDIGDTVRWHAERFDWVFTSGGVGPTHDDLTIPAIAAAFGAGVVVDPSLAQVLRDYWGDGMPAANLRLAEMPEGAELVRGPAGTTTERWPVVCYRNVYILPGVPRLFQQKFLDIRERFRCVPMAWARVYIDAQEGRIAERLDHVVATHPAVKIGSYPRFGETDFRVLLILESHDREALAAATTALEHSLAEWLVRIERSPESVPG